MIKGWIRILTLAGWWVWAGWGGLGGLQARSGDEPHGDHRLPSIGPSPPYVGSAACRECHPKEHESWQRTFHRSMTQLMTGDRMVGAFDGTTVRSDGLEYRVFRVGEEWWAEMPDPDVMMYVVQGGRQIPWERIPRVCAPVVMATGSHHYQTYWVASPRYAGLLQTLPLVYLIGEGRWVPREAAFMRGPGDRGRLVTQWNHHCIRCHSTSGNPGLDEATGLLRSSVVELGISCEACHGPGEAHAQRQRELAGGGGQPGMMEQDDTITNPAHLDARRSSQICGQCHGVFVFRDEYAIESAREGSLYRPGQDLHRARHYMQHPRAGSSPAREAEWERNRPFFQERWWDDGTILAGGREYTAFLASPCHTRGELSCLTCHSMHKSDPAGQLKEGAKGSEVCLECHTGAEYSTEVRRHTFHAAGSAGSDCLNCHMPHTSYALFRAIRSHQITSPRMESSARYGTPNACNLCHLDRTMAWAQRWLGEWYGQGAAGLSEEQREVAAGVFWMVKGNAAQRVIAGWHLGWGPAQAASGTRWMGPMAGLLLDDDYGVIRYVAAKALRTLPGMEQLTFDFLGSEGDRAEAAREVRRRWEAGRREEAGPRPEVLLKQDGELDGKRLIELLRGRDRRPVTIKE